MKVTAFDFWDTERMKGVQLDTKELGLKKLKKNKIFNIDDVTYIVTKVFTKKSLSNQKLIETRMIKYKIPNTVSSHVHKCLAKLVQMKDIGVKQRTKMVKQYGETTVNSWQKDGRVKLRVELFHQCPDCKVTFYKDKNVKPKGMEVVSLKGKKRLKKRK